MTRAHAIFLAEQRTQLIALLASEGAANGSSDSGLRCSHIAELYDELSMVESALDGISSEQLALLMTGKGASRETGRSGHTIVGAAALEMLSGIKFVGASIAGLTTRRLSRRSS